MGAPTAAPIATAAPTYRWGPPGVVPDKGQATTRLLPLLTSRKGVYGLHVSMVLVNQLPGGELRVQVSFSAGPAQLAGEGKKREFTEAFIKRISDLLLVKAHQVT